MSNQHIDFDALRRKFADVGRNYELARLQKIGDLNTAVIPNADGVAPPIRDKRGIEHSSDGKIEVVFAGLEPRLVYEISQWPVVVGCVAWLSSWPVIEALAARDAVSLLVNKEDFLRPDTGRWSDIRLRLLYATIPNTSRWLLGLDDYSFADSNDHQAIRCVGLGGGSRNRPRLHHKFLVFCDRHNAPQAVWTGSFNPTDNATRSLENAVIIRDETIADAYHKEWVALFGISEPLDWTSRWVAPEYRIGT